MCTKHEVAKVLDSASSRLLSSAAWLVVCALPFSWEEPAFQSPNRLDL